MHVDGRLPVLDGHERGQDQQSAGIGNLQSKAIVSRPTCEGHTETASRAELPAATTRKELSCLRPTTWTAASQARSR
jgi:hypothetical protein